MDKPVNRENITAEARVQSVANICGTIRAERNTPIGFGPGAPINAI